MQFSIGNREIEKYWGSLVSINIRNIVSSLVMLPNGARSMMRFSKSLCRRHPYILVETVIAYNCQYRRPIPQIPQCVRKISHTALQKCVLWIGDWYIVGYDQVYCNEVRHGDNQFWFRYTYTILKWSNLYRPHIITRNYHKSPLCHSLTCDRT